MTVPAPTPVMGQPLALTMPAPMTYQENAPPPLPDVSDAVRARVTQRLQGAPDPFLLADEDSPSDEEPLQARERGGLLSQVSCAPGILILWLG